MARPKPPEPPAVAAIFPEDDCYILMTSVLPFAKMMLAKHRAFFPYGGFISAAGRITHVGGWVGEEHPNAADVISLLNRGFRKDAIEGTVRATALVYDVRTIPPGKTEKQDAIAVNLDHRDGYSVVVVFPYAFSDAGELIVSESFTAEGAASIFARPVTPGG